MNQLRNALLLIFAFFSLWGGAETVTVKTGTLRGISKAGTDAYLGIPFAAPPVKTLRWKAPAPPAPWTGVRAADKLPPACAQLSVSREVVGSEDCLYLNAWVPKAIKAKAPVIVYIHGGGLMSGQTSDALYDGANLAASGNLIVVTIQYRLAELGYLAHPALSNETPYGGSGNYGLMDQLAALKWVAENISAFGGDPANVTLMGESGGASSACALMASPLSRGLFARVILESQSCPAIGKPLAELEGMQRALKAGCPGTGSDVTACLRNAAVGKVLQTSPLEMVSRTDHRRTTSQLNVDNYALPELPLKLIQSGKGQPVPLLLGNNASEGIFFVPIYETPAQLKAQIIQFYGEAVAKLVYSLYQGDWSEMEQAQAIFADTLFDCRTRRLARAKKKGDGAPVYRYLYTHNATFAGFPLPATHAAELPFVFQNLTSLPSITGPDREVARHMLSYWTQFVRTGNPNSSSAPLWEEFRPERDNYLVINRSPAMDAGRHYFRCDLQDLLDPR